MKERGARIDSLRFSILVIVLGIIAVLAGYLVIGQDYVDTYVVKSDSKEKSESGGTEEVIEEVESGKEVESYVIVDIGFEEGSEEVFLDLDEVEVVNFADKEVEIEDVYVDIDGVEDEGAKVIVEEDISNYERALENNPRGGENEEERVGLIEEDDSVNERVVGDECDRAISAEWYRENCRERVEEIREENSDVKLVPYVLYDSGKKVIETEIEEDREIDIEREESVEESDKLWKKEVVVSSDEHFDRELRVYADVIESDGEIEIVWENEDISLEFEEYDVDNNGMTDEVSWIVPHLSVQTFEIIVNLEGIEDENVTEISIEIMNEPEGVLDNNDTVEFDFDVTYYNISVVRCNFTLENSEGIVDERPNLILNNGENIEYYELVNGNYNWDLVCFDMINNSVSDSDSGDFVIGIDYGPLINFTSDKTSVVDGENIIFEVEIHNPEGLRTDYQIDYDDGSNLDRKGPFWNNHDQKSYGHSFTDRGNYDVNLKVYMDTNLIYDENIVIEVTNSTPLGDTEGPDITLLEPSNDRTISSENIRFKFKVDDESAVDNCTFNLYYFNYSNVGDLDYDLFDDSISKNEENVVELTNFDEGEHTWEVECIDEHGNYDNKERDFRYVIFESNDNNNEVEEEEIKLDDETAQKLSEIEEVIEAINEFLIDSGKYNKEEKEAVEDMGLVDEMVFFKKQLLNFELDLSANLESIRDEDRREKRRNEILDEIEDIKKKVPSSFLVVKTDDFLKNSVDVDMTEVVDSYVEAKRLILSKSGKRQLLAHNEELQNHLSVDVKLKHVEIEYFTGEDEKITLVKKGLDNSIDYEGNYIEVIPKDVAENLEDVFFFVDYEIINEDPIVEIDSDDVKNDEFVYYINRLVDLNDVSAVDTLLFEESDGGISGISGFSVLLDSGTYSGFMIYLGWIILIMVFIVGGFYGTKQVKVMKIRDRVEVKAILGIIKDSEMALQYKDLERAKSNYGKIEELYEYLPQECKGAIYGKIGNLKLSIDKKEVGGLISECMTAIREGRKDDAVVIYDQVQEIFSRVPKKLQKKIYERIVPLAYMLR